MHFWAADFFFRDAAGATQCIGPSSALENDGAARLLEDAGLSGDRCVRSLAARAARLCSLCPTVPLVDTTLTRLAVCAPAVHPAPPPPPPQRPHSAPPSALPL